MDKKTKTISILYIIWSSIVLFSNFYIIIMKIIASNLIKNGVKNNFLDIFMKINIANFRYYIISMAILLILFSILTLKNIKYSKIILVLLICIHILALIINFFFNLPLKNFFITSYMFEFVILIFYIITNIILITQLKKYGI